MRLSCCAPRHTAGGRREGGKGGGGEGGREGRGEEREVKDLVTTFNFIYR